MSALSRRLDSLASRLDAAVAGPESPAAAAARVAQLEAALPPLQAAAGAVAGLEARLTALSSQVGRRGVQACPNLL